MTKYTVTIVVKIDNEAKTDKFEIGAEYLNHYLIDASHSINLEFFFSQKKESFKVSWKDTNGDIRTESCDKENILEELVENQRYVLAFIASCTDVPGLIPSYR